MNQVLSIPRNSGRDTVRLSGVSWLTYSRLLRTFEEQPGVRLAYDHGELEIMSPRFGLDDDTPVIGALVLVLAEELGITLKHGGSTTLRRKLKKKGIESDECFWLANAPQMAGRRRLDLRRDPPPDLAIEVDVTSSSLDRLGIYAALRVPELWRLDADILTFHLLAGRGRYVQADRSRAFPIISPTDLMSLILKARRAGDVISIIRQFRRWVRQRRNGSKK